MNKSIKSVRAGSLCVVESKDGKTITLENRTRYPMSVNPMPAIAGGVGFGIFVDTSQNAKTNKVQHQAKAPRSAQRDSKGR